MPPSEGTLRGANALVHLGAGIGNIVFATPLLVSLNELGLKIDVLLSADYAETAGLFAGWSAVAQVVDSLSRTRKEQYDYLIPALPPFYWPRFRLEYRGLRRCVARPDDSLFYQNEQEFYLHLRERWDTPALHHSTRCPSHRGAVTSASTRTRSCWRRDAKPARWLRNDGHTSPIWPSGSAT